MSEKSSTFVVLKGWGKTQKYGLRHIPFYICIFIQIWGADTAPPCMVVVSTLTDVPLQIFCANRNALYHDAATNCRPCPRLNFRRAD